MDLVKNFFMVLCHLSNTVTRGVLKKNNIKSVGTTRYVQTAQHVSKKDVSTFTLFFRIDPQIVLITSALQCLAYPIRFSELKITKLRVFLNLHKIINNTRFYLVFFVLTNMSTKSAILWEICKLRQIISSYARQHLSRFAQRKVRWFNQYDTH